MKMVMLKVFLFLMYSDKCQIFTGDGQNVITKFDENGYVLEDCCL